MRYRGIYAVFENGFVVAIVRGHYAARTLSPERAYKRFGPDQEIDAEEFATWWNYEHERRIAERIAFSTKG